VTRHADVTYSQARYVTFAHDCRQTSAGCEAFPGLPGRRTCGQCACCSAAGASQLTMCATPC
jgi:hypothetical protein